MPQEILDTPNLIIAAEDFDSLDFARYHRFSQNDERILSKLIAHGPVLLRGGRGSGKSALMIEAERRISEDTGQQVFALYISLRHLELIRSSGREYERFLCKLLIDRLRDKLNPSCEDILDGADSTVGQMQRFLAQLSVRMGRRIVLLFDDAAHIGREASLAEFFDVFRTISSSTVSCKAAIYPGVTRFGTRFDVFNDATVIDLSKSDEVGGHREFFSEVMTLRFSSELPDALFQGNLSRLDVAGFLGSAVLGNMRSFIFACNSLAERLAGRAVGLQDLNETLLSLAQNYYWPLLEEVQPKLGRYAPMVSVAHSIGGILFEACGKADRKSAVVLREIAERLSKPLEILEYAGFIIRREVSRAMKSGGRGARYALNLCNLLENTAGTRLTNEVFRRWTQEFPEPAEFHRGSKLQTVNLPTEEGPDELGVLSLPIEKLEKSNAYPYGLTPKKIEVLKEAGISTVGDLADASDDVLKSLPYVGDAMVKRFRNVVGQAIWM